MSDPTLELVALARRQARHISRCTGALDAYRATLDTYRELFQSIASLLPPAQAEPPFRRFTSAAGCTYIDFREARHA